MGRRNEGLCDSRLEIRLPRAVREKLVEVATSKKRPQAVILREAIRFYLSAQNETPATNN